MARDLSLMYLGADDDGSFASMRELPQGPGVITVIRTVAGVPGSRIEAYATQSPDPDRSRWPLMGHGWSARTALASAGSLHLPAQG